MQTYVAMLRGINVGGKNKIAMKDLQELLLPLGYADVTTYIQSGNLIFHGPPRDPSEVAREIEDAIKREFDLQVAVIVRTREELAEVVAANPFREQGVAPSHLHITFLVDRPDSNLVEAIAVPESREDAFQLIGREVYLHCPHGYGNTKLNNAFWERRLRTTATTRNWNTIDKLLELAKE